MWIAAAQNSRCPDEIPVVEHDEGQPAVCCENRLKRVRLRENNS